MSTSNCGCSSNLVSTMRGPKGDTGEQGLPGANGSDGVLDWSQYDLACWVSEGIVLGDDDQDEISQKFIDAFCDVYQAINVLPKATNDYIDMNKNGTVYIQVVNNDLYYPDVTVTITVAPSNGTATVEPDNKTIKYIPDTDWTGVEDFEYTITDTNANTDSATVTVTVNNVLDSVDVEAICLTKVIEMLQSEDYWDLGFNIGDKILISNSNLVDFDIVTPGIKGKGLNRYKRWAICNGNNGTEDLMEGTFRGYNQDNPDYDASAESGGSDSITLTTDNIPAHRHTGIASAVEDTAEVELLLSNAAISAGVTNVTRESREGQDWGNTGAELQVATAYYNTGDGTTNVSNEDEVANGTGTVTDLDIRNAYKTVIVIQKISNVI